MSFCCGNDENERRLNKPRGCTDILCLVIFGIFWSLLIFLASFAFVVGDPTRLAYGQDSFGNTCGMKNEPLGYLTFSGMDMTDRPYLFFLNMTNVHNSLKICVKQCPDKPLSNGEEIRSFEKETGSSLCRYDIASFMERSTLYPLLENLTLEDVFNEIEKKTGHHPCPLPPIYQTKTLFNRCIPVPVASLAADVIYSIYAYLNSFDIIQQVVSDIYAGRWEILGMIALSLVLSFIMALTIHCLASVVSWIIIVVSSVAAIIGTGILWWTYIDIKWQLDQTFYNQLLEESAKNERTFLIYAIISTICTVILLLIVLVLRKQVHLVVKLFEEAGYCIRSMPCLLLQPLWTFCALVIFFVYWIAVLLALATAYYPVKNEINSPLQMKMLSTTPTPSSDSHLNHQEILSQAFTLVSFSESSWVQYMWWYHIIALIWTSEFILGCQQMVIAGAVASWYFSVDRSSVKCPIGRSISRLTIYHLGSVALGSFLITLCKIPRMILSYLSKKMKKYEDIKIVSYCLKCCICCLWCLEKCIRYLNHNAYTVIAIQGVGFCTASREAFGILMSNAIQVATINSVGDFILFLGKCGVTAITTFVGVLIMKNDPQLHFYAIPVFLVCLFSFFIAHCVLSIYEMVIDTLFLCCCEDMSRNDGSKEKPYYSGSLVRYLKGGEEEPMQPLSKPSGDITDTD